MVAQTDNVARTNRKAHCMILIVYSQVQEDSLQQNLGKPEYSYFFVFKQFLPVLERLGTVIVVRDANEADAICNNAAKSGEQCIFICCAPPHRSVTARLCPTTTLFAWEFADITTESWDDDPRTDWRNVFAAHGQTICLSSYTADTVKKSMGQDFPVRAIPVPVYDQFVLPQSLHNPTERKYSISIRGNVIDTRYYVIDDDQFAYEAPPHYFVHRPWDRATTYLDFAHRAEASGLLGGFYESEPWGTWSRARVPWIYLPFTLQGKCRITLNATGFANNVNRRVQLEVGEQKLPFVLTNGFNDHVFDVDLIKGVNLIRICGLDNTPVAGSDDPRSMAIGVRLMRIENTNLLQCGTTTATVATDTVNNEQPEVKIALEGIIYTTVLNPADGRKNWEEILTAFCYAFRDRANVTLVIKITHHSIASFLGTLNYFLQCVGPMQCRIVALHGFLDDTQYRQLIEATSFYVNASRCEGLCLPLIEFMSACKPAIAPDHTAMRDYVTPASTFIVASAPEPAIWPQDPRVLLRTYFYRIEWESLVTALRDSYAVITQDLPRYHDMGKMAAENVKRCCANDVVEKSLHEFLQTIIGVKADADAARLEGGI